MGTGDKQVKPLVYLSFLCENGKYSVYHNNILFYNNLTPIFFKDM